MTRPIKHSVAINSNPLLQTGRNVRRVRQSRTRRYGACLVATVTSKTVRQVEECIQDHQFHLEETQAALDAIQLATSLTQETARALHEAQVTPWFKALFDEEHAIREARKAQTGRPFYGLTERDRDQARQTIISRGAQDPYQQAPHLFLEALQARDLHANRLDFLKRQALVEGQQVVLSWHRDAGLAEKALSGATARSYRDRHYTVQIRTDIQHEE